MVSAYRGHTGEGDSKRKGPHKGNGMGWKGWHQGRVGELKGWNSAHGGKNGRAELDGKRKIK